MALATSKGLYAWSLAGQVMSKPFVTVITVTVTVCLVCFVVPPVTVTSVLPSFNGGYLVKKTEWGDWVEPARRPLGCHKLTSL